jgi:hypothetical protein
VWVFAWSPLMALAMSAARIPWELVRVPFAKTDHPWQMAHPVLCSDRRLREILKVTAPDPYHALAETVPWLWENREALAAG